MRDRAHKSSPSSGLWFSHIIILKEMKAVLSLKQIHLSVNHAFRLKTLSLAFLTKPTTSLTINILMFSVTSWIAPARQQCSCRLIRIQVDRLLIQLSHTFMHEPFDLIVVTCTAWVIVQSLRCVCLRVAFC